MAYEIEIKLAIRNNKALLRALKRLGAKPANPKAPRMHEMNLIFDTPDGGLAKHGQLLRIRTETPAPAKKSLRLGSLGRSCSASRAEGEASES